MNETGQTFFSSIGIVEYDEKIWFAARETNGLFQIDLQDKVMRYFGEIPNEKKDFINLYGQCIILDQKIYFAPYNADYMAVYDIDTGMFEKILIKKNGNGYAGYFTIINCNENILLLPAKGRNNIVKLHKNMNGIEYIKNWKEKIGCEDSDGDMFWEYCIKDDILYAPIISAKGQIMRYDMYKDEISFFHTYLEEKFRCICCDNNYFYLTSQSGNILTILDKTFRLVGTKIISEYENIQIDHLIYKNGYVFLFTINDYEGQLPDMIIVFHVESNEMKTICSISANNARRNISCMVRNFSVSVKNDDFIIAFHGGNSTLYTINTLELSIDRYEILTNGIEEVIKNKTENISDGIQFWEKRICPSHLQILIDSVKDRENKNKSKVRYGEKIWKYIKESAE